MSFFHITFSPTGGTKKAGDCLTAPWSDNCIEISLLPPDTDYSSFHFHKDDFCVLGVPSFGGRVPAPATERLLQMQADHTPCLLLVTYGNRAYEDTLAELKETAKQAGFFPIAAAAAVTEHSIMRQFAQGRPDENDCHELSDFSRKVLEKFSSGHPLSEVSVPGKEPYRPYGTIPMLPKAGNNCTGCGLCARECPTGAILSGHPALPDSSKCISCMRCISICPNQARSLEPEVLSAASAKLQNVLSGHKENEFFL